MRKLWIDGKYIDGEDEPRPALNPATGQVIDEVSWATSNQAVCCRSCGKKGSP
jgi:acyl-CoA reductase-like NAD-dependent aldehyde dehydrogenase